MLTENACTIGAGAKAPSPSPSHLPPRALTVADQLRRIRERALQATYGIQPLAGGGVAAAGAAPGGAATSEAAPAASEAAGAPTAPPAPALRPLLLRLPPRTLTLEVALPAPAPLPPVESMCPQDCLRELMAVGSQRGTYSMAVER